jgi:hypothetical protein
MSDIILNIVLPLILPPLITEGALWIMRFSRVQKAGYVWAACLLRAIAYSPCMLGAGHGGLPMPLGSAIYIWLGESGATIECFYGVLVLALMPFTYGFTAIAAEKREARGRANQRLQGTPGSVPSSSSEPEARRP